MVPTIGGSQGGSDDFWSFESASARRLRQFEIVSCSWSASRSNMRHRLRLRLAECSLVQIAAASSLRRDPARVVRRLVLAGTLRLFLPVCGRVASCRRSIGVSGTGFVRLVRQRNGFEIHLRWYCRPPG